MSTELAVSEIIVGPRVRSDVGNLAPLKASIEELGLLHPVVVNLRHELIAGGRRLAAVKGMGWTRVPVTVVGSLDDAVKALKAELAENTERAPLSPTDMHEAGAKLAELERADAAKRQAAAAAMTNAKLGRGKKDASTTVVEASLPGLTQDKIGEALGISGDHWRNIETAHELVEQGGEELSDLKERLATPGAKVKPIIREARERLAEPKPTPEPASKPDDPKPTADPGNKPTRKPVGVDLAQEAVNCLKRIPINDAHRDKAKSIVLNFVNAHF